MAYPIVWYSDYALSGGRTFEATNGAHGSFSYVNVDKYGPRGYKSNASDNLDGFATQGAIPKLIVPGGGGGARPLPTYKRGSKSPGYSPNGIVLIRLVRINPI